MFSTSKSPLQPLRRLLRDPHAPRTLIQSVFQDAADMIAAHTPDPEEEDRRAREREMYEGSLSKFLQGMWHVIEPGNDFQDGWHIQCISEHLEAFFRGEIPRLIINMPPRHCKSILCSVALFCWGWAKAPETRWLYSAHQAGLASRDLIKSRDVIMSEWFQDLWGHKFGLKHDMNNTKRVMNDVQGYRYAMHVGSGATGDGGDFIITDDPISAGAAERSIERLKCQDWWTRTMTSRVIDPRTTRRLIVQQRLNSGDLAGCMMRGYGYESLILPVHGSPKRLYVPGWAAEPTPEDEAKIPPDAIVPTRLQLSRPDLLDGRDEGALLWPERFTAEEIDRQTRDMRGAAAGQFEQRPADDEGAIFKDGFFRFARLESRGGVAFAVLRGKDGSQKAFPVADIEWFQIADTAYETHQNADFTAVGTFGLTPDFDLIVFDIFRERIEVPDQLPVILALKTGRVRWDRKAGKMVGTAEDSPWPFEVSWQGVEPKASGAGVIQAARRLGVFFRKIKAPAGAGKVARCAPILTMYEEGAVFHMEHGLWRLEVEKELKNFPNDAHDDAVDVIAYAGLYADRRARKGAKRTTKRSMIYDAAEKPGDDKKDAQDFLADFAKAGLDARPAHDIPEDSPWAHLIGVPAEPAEVAAKPPEPDTPEKKPMSDAFADLLRQLAPAPKTDEEDRPRFRGLNRPPSPGESKEEAQRHVISSMDD